MIKNDCYLGFVDELHSGEVCQSLENTKLKGFRQKCDEEMVTWFVLTKNCGLILPYELYTPPKKSQPKYLIFNKTYHQLNQFRKCFVFMAQEDAWCFDLIRFLREKGIWIARIRDIQKIENAAKSITITRMEYFALLKALKRKVEAFKPEVIVGLKQGGTLPAAYCAEHLNCPLFNLKISRYNGRKPSTPVISNNIPEVKGKRVAVIDDLVDEGKTVKTALTKLKERQPSALKPFVLLYKDGAEAKVEYIKKVPRRWLSFWYD